MAPGVTSSEPPPAAAFLLTGRSLVAGSWVSGDGAPWASACPAEGQPLLCGRSAGATEVNAAFGAAQRALPEWTSRSPAERLALAEEFRQVLTRRAGELAVVIARETGKPIREAREEVTGMIAKVALSRDAQAERCPARDWTEGPARLRLRQRPVGIVAVLGPFNLPGHLPNAQLLAALLAGNVVIFKPSEKTPATGELLVRCWLEAGLPPGVLQLLQGTAPTGAAIVNHPGVNAVFFTGSHRAGTAIHRALAGRPEVLLALEMGGNNPLIVTAHADRELALSIAVESAFRTAGQRCTCARRLILVGSRRDLLDDLVARSAALRVAAPFVQPAPDLGPVIDEAAAAAAEAFVATSLAQGARLLAPLRRLVPGRPFLTPAILDETNTFAATRDEEVFAPVLRVTFARDFAEALAQAAATRYGLAAGLVSERLAEHDAFMDAMPCGVLAINRPTTGASGRLPFGGHGASGNHRPAGWHLADACNQAVAVLAPAV